MRPAIEEILGRIGGRRDIDAETLPALQIDEAIRGDGEKPGLKRTAPLIFREQSGPIGPRAEAIGPKVGHQIFRFGLVRAAGAQDTNQFPVIAAPQFRRSRSIAGEYALDEAQILFVTRRSFDGHRAEKDGVARRQRQSF